MLHFPSFLPSDIFLVHWKMDRGHCLHQYAAGSSDVLWKWNIGVHEKRGVSKNFFFASSTSDTDSKAKNNDRWRHLFFDPTIFTSSIIMNNQTIIMNNHLIILTTPTPPPPIFDGTSQPSGLVVYMLHFPSFLPSYLPTYSIIMNNHE